MLKEKLNKIKQFIKNKLSVINFNSGNPLFIILIIILAVLVIVTVILQLTLFQTNRKNAGTFIEVSHVSTPPPSIPSPSISPTPPPTPKPIPSGKIDFTIGFGDKTIPQMGKGWIDPYDPPKGGTQTVNVHVIYSQPVTKVTAILKTDNSISKPYLLKLVEGSPTDGNWQGSWQINDTYLYTYNLVLQAESGSSQSKFEFTLR